MSCLSIRDGWNGALRLCRTRPEILDGRWELAAVEPFH